MLVRYTSGYSPVEVSIPECSWNQCQTDHLGNFAITYFLGCFRPWNFKETKERYQDTCGQNFRCFFAILSEIFPVEFRVLELSWNQFQTGQFVIFNITSFMGLVGLWKFWRTEETYKSISGKIWDVGSLHFLIYALWKLGFLNAPEISIK